MDHARWLQDFEREVARRRRTPDPEWTVGAKLAGPVAKSVQRFQVGEAGDGANLIAKAAGNDVYLAAVRLFVAEEQNHARLLAALLGSADVPTIDAHWSDAVFVRLRRALGLRLELMVLLIAEVVALRYYRALRDGSGDPLTADVAGRILADEQRHVPFHCHRLYDAFASLPAFVRAVAFGGWRLLAAGATAVVVLDHGRALRRLGVGRIRFAVDVFALFEAAIADVRQAPAMPQVPPVRRARPRGLV